MGKKKDEETFIELPCLQFVRSRTLQDMELDKVEFSVKAETSEKCLGQFKSMLKLLDIEDQTQLKKINKK